MDFRELHSAVCGTRLGGSEFGAKEALDGVGIFHTIKTMANRAVKKTISLPSELARELEEQARAERKTLVASSRKRCGRRAAGGSEGSFISCRGIRARKLKRKESSPSAISRALPASARVVFDTYIFVSALILPGSRAEEALARVIQGDDHLILSNSVL